MEAREVKMRAVEAAILLNASKLGVHSTPEGVLTTAEKFVNYVLGGEAAPKGNQTTSR